MTTNVVPLFATKDRISFECGHFIEVTIGQLESMHDGMDMRYCPECRQAVNAARARTNELLLECADEWRDKTMDNVRGSVQAISIGLDVAHLFVASMRGNEMPVECVWCDTRGGASCLVGACPISY